MITLLWEALIDDDDRDEDRDDDDDAEDVASTL